ncbi:tRNA uridine-5-carboxymethylaminomethyl(34) synthesis GTPase MnmE [Agrobacterium rubi]|uniref:tRNA modification GTPase MnmE n=1 Tax=Agrobacterium rubi TaxID=28099 RepID=A0AAE7R101_9HYPH|nr:tRNA uridine-5-carboxymethylaminomethyl(34) synthesis GTPase MnmE [Agrobacterium rubi]NTE87561.1 tRNA uridine-5-carboxymethylaminomethyl(34) synthesis GTPase MnmE [Agrobacterium rubi]NTF03415.1 tRNA uridine-5-carboxymethylaminomethyl(34) synthesis GTPase MnmE [Agrobacterium rubi]NTF37575.1 tRNA uridine-5-carboxymethylaminomethyl(34) synthesis GTPase MnmE [Agrobacterium rubi]OCJ45727.1 tRNA uridine(34) 5-carboxymethylaminomethyl synthesis GTPase MnmE [Agrobacterium rubi]QTG00258.1 tRNA uridi
MSLSTDTIYALSSGSLPAGVAILRISGPLACQALETLTRSALPAPRMAALKTIRNRNDEVIDQGLVLFFPAPHSFTGEDCVEIHVHGSRAVVDAVFTELNAIPEVRPADAGEFSKRAYDNGKMDLLEVEGLADLLKAETEMQRRLAVEQTSGRLSELYDGWAHRLTRCRALIEAELDFSDEEDVPDSVADQVWKDVATLRAELDQHLTAGSGNELIRDGFKVALLGSPNVGKSTLLNALSGRDVAIVTDIAGTTRDVLSIDLNIDGYLVTFFDTAGLRETNDIVEQEGVRRARRTAENADLILLLSDFDSEPQQLNENVTARTLRVATKSDSHEVVRGTYDIALSAKTGAGLDQLRSAIKIEIEKRVGSSLTLAPVRARHKKRLEETLNYVSDALTSDGMDLAIRSEYLRLAATALGRMTGRVDVEDLLGVIFSEFCIGK